MHKEQRMSMGYDVEKAASGHTETTKSVETSQKANCKGLPKGFKTRQEMKEKIERRSGISMGYGFDIHESRKKVEKAPGGHTGTTKSDETSSKMLPKGFKTWQEMELKLKRGPEKAASFPVSDDDAPYISASHGRITYITTPKIRENDKTYWHDDKANIASKHKETTQMEETYSKKLPKGFKTRQEMELKLKTGPEKAASFPVSDDDAPYISAPHGRITYITTPKTRENNETDLPYDEANIATNNNDVDCLLGLSSHQQYSCYLEPVNSDVNDDTKYDQRVEMSSTTSTGARPKTRRNDTYCISGNEAYVIDNSARHRGDRTNTKKNDIRKAYEYVVMTMNTNGQNEKMLEEPQDKRREVITKLLKTYTPAIMFCQEFQSTGICGRVWSKYGINTNYIFYGNKEGNILAHKELDVHPSVDGEQINTVLRRILEGLQRSSANMLNETFPLEFDPLSRMCMYCANIKLKDGNTRMLLCASWHGWWNKKNREGRIELFRYLIEFLRHVFIKFNLPLIIGGDFNIEILDVKDIVKDPFSLGMYASSKRRKDKEKDFFIVSKDLKLENIQCIDYEEDAGFSAMLKEFNPNDILDHDPIKALLKFA